ncbi:MAG: hypothetical protein ACRDPL_04305, partial [Propionibacteriaceae bacterium]
PFYPRAPLAQPWDRRQRLFVWPLLEAAGELFRRRRGCAPWCRAILNATRLIPRDRSAKRPTPLPNAGGLSRGADAEGAVPSDDPLIAA